MGSATGGERLQIRLYDLLAHGWDLAQATGIPLRLPEDLADGLGVAAGEAGSGVAPITWRGLSLRARAPP